MRRIFLLAWRYVAYNRLKTAILVSCVTITIVLPVVVHVLIRQYSAELVARAEATPLVVGAKGDRYDLCLKSLYFKGEVPDPIAWREVLGLVEGGLCTPLPLHLGYTARKLPVVGTIPEYFEFRRLRLAKGTAPLILGDAALGGRAAEELGLGPGDSIISDQINLYDISRQYPLKMHLTGVFEPAGTPDDYCVFVDVKTAWVIEGIGHGHRDMAREAPPTAVLERSETNVTVDSSIVEFNEITPENIHTFHYHGDPDGFPVTSVVVVPHTKKARTLLRGRYGVSKDTQMLVPVDVIEELTGIVFKVEAFFNANFAVVAVSTGLFFVLVVMLSLRLRRREMDTMFKIGCSRMTVFWLQAAEIIIILLMSAALAGVLSGGLTMLAPDLMRIL